MVGEFCAAAALLLLWSGVVKLRRPGPAAQMLVALFGRPFPARHLTVRALGGLELTISLGVFFIGGRIAAAALAVCYLAFTAVAARLASGVRRAPCGCFGRSETPTGWVHVATDLVAAAVALAGVVRPFGAFAGHAGQDGVVVAVGLGQVVVLAGLTYLLITALPELLAAREQVVARS